MATPQQRPIMDEKDRQRRATPHDRLEQALSKTIAAARVLEQNNREIARVLAPHPDLISGEESETIQNLTRVIVRISPELDQIRGKLQGIPSYQHGSQDEIETSKRDQEARNRVGTSH
jgi:hypothetical protein